MFMRNVICVILFGLFCVVLWIDTQEIECCAHATGSCRSVCETVTLVEFAADVNTRNQTILKFQPLCSPQLLQFWSCLNDTLNEISKGEEWHGRTCCSIPQSEKCRRACVSAVSREELSTGCRQSDELSFFTCLDRQDLGKECCEDINENECMNTCWEIFKTHKTPTKEQRNQIVDSCHDTNPEVLQCVKNFIKVTPAQNTHKHLHCCEKSSNYKCVSACKRVLKSKTTHQEIVDSLQEVCGPPLFHSMFWQCFLHNTNSLSTSFEVSRIDRLGMDSAKLHCCSRAHSIQCRKLCAKTFTNDWSGFWEDFNEKCLNQLSEEDLQNCIDEVEEPCELGCDGLSYCTNFNNRPTELFRSCNLQADEAAKFDVAFWQEQDYLTLPGLYLSVRNISRCSPDTWKAIACMLQIKPCSRYSHLNQICYDSCLEILNNCLDDTKMPPEHTAETLCSKLSSKISNTSCISLQHFMKPSDDTYNVLHNHVSSPCKSDPCSSNQVCTVNRDCISGKNCQPFICIPGCKLGEVSQYVVPEDTFVRIPVVTGQNGCLKICKCSDGKIEKCHPLPCFLYDPCWIGKDKIEHGASFYMDCNMCTCFAGEIICSKRQCENTGLSLSDPTYTTLPCNCPRHYIPVCGANGITYPNLCLAKCAGLSDVNLEFGSCEDVCNRNPCPVGQECVPDLKVCLSLMHRPCQQYECINSTVNCHRLPKEPVCDSNNEQHPNTCFLVRRNKKFAYRGPCLQNCDHTVTVCGINGKTYVSECAALGDYVTVDYLGICSRIGLISDSKKDQCNDNNLCTPLPQQDYIGYTPPGACCPIYGGIIRMLYSRKQIDRALYVLHGHLDSLKSLTLKSVLKALERQVKVAQCSLSGYLSIELDIIVIVRPAVPQPSDLQIKTCIREAEKLASLVNKQSPRITSDLSLSALIASTLMHTTEQSNDGGLFSQPNYTIIMFILFLIHIVWCLQ